MTSGREALLTMMLDCGSDDLRLLDDVGYVWYDIFADAEEVAELGGINNIMRQVFMYGYFQIGEAVADRICELENIAEEGELTPEEEYELNMLRDLRPTAGDFSSYHNYLDTHVYCEHNSDTYQRYMQDALDDFAEGTGFDITM